MIATLFLFVARRLVLPFSATLVCVTSTLVAEIRVPAIFGDHMVLQRGQVNPVWGWADPGEDITVHIGQQVHSAVADEDGWWQVRLDPLQVGASLELTISGKNTLSFRDVVAGEVWLCSGQSNMQWPVSASKDADLEIRTARHPKIRMITVPQVGTQEPQDNFEGSWQECSPGTVYEFSAVGYFFGRQLLQTLDVPVGLIDNSWGGSAIEAWISRDLLLSERRYQGLLERWAEIESTYDHEKVLADYDRELSSWRKERQIALEREEEPPVEPRPPRNPLTGQHRPANLYNGVLHPIIGYGIRGVIWYQGESNVNRAHQYRHLFPLMIQSWREAWNQGNFPFYWVQLADFRDESVGPVESEWAELREAQTMTLDRLPNTAQAVIIDLGEAGDIHPRNKQDVAMRLARLALARDYGLNLTYESPAFGSQEVRDRKILLTFKQVGGGLDTFDVSTPLGFTIAGEDRKFYPAEALIVGKDRVEVWSTEVTNPVAVRYAWADNPVCNLQNTDGLPVVPFRTDDWPGLTADNQ